MTETPTGPTPLRPITPLVDALLTGMAGEDYARAVRQLDELGTEGSALAFPIGDPSLARRIELVEERRVRDKKVAMDDLAFLGTMIQTDRANIERLYTLLNWTIAALVATALMALLTLALVLRG